MNWNENSQVTGVHARIGTDPSQIRMHTWTNNQGELCIVVRLGNSVSLHVSDASPEALLHLSDVAAQCAELRVEHPRSEDGPAIVRVSHLSVLATPDKDVDES